MRTASVPFGVLIMGLLSLVPLLLWNARRESPLWQAMLPPVFQGVLATVLLFLVGVKKPEHLALALAASTAFFVNLEIVLSLIWRNGLRAGGYVAHVGVGLMIVGIITSTVYDVAPLLVSHRSRGGLSGWGSTAPSAGAVPTGTVTAATEKEPDVHEEKAPFFEARTRQNCVPRDRFFCGTYRVFLVVSLTSTELNEGSLSICRLNSVTPLGRDHDSTGVELLAIATASEPGVPTAAVAAGANAPRAAVPSIVSTNWKTSTAPPMTAANVNIVSIYSPL